ncbi:type I-F CRISPR-associated endoribonuclease Cas6/Csy4 [Endozoicomonas sp. Mp262]|uniref:type I-F CRISPR-associated endoribonuclease Cas6/Csy4 n=1 Tax=Endozoicomonas sp. Mp262 TaxID=2919499 RepID=UPI0021D8ADB3
MAERFYMDYQLPGVELINTSTISSIITILHGYQARNELSLGLSFPEFSDFSLGNILRIISTSKHDLMKFNSHSIIQLLQKNNNISPGSIITEHKKEKQYRFIRDRRLDRRTASRWVRKKSLTEHEALDKVNYTKRKFPIKDTLHGIWLRSKKGQLFKIYIRKELANEQLFP